MNQLISVIAVIVISLAGVQVLKWIWPQIRTKPPYLQLGLGYCVGTAVICFIFFSKQIIGLSFTRVSILVPICLLAVGGCIGIFRPITCCPQWNLFVFLAILLLCLSLSLTWMRPIYGYDAISMWALKAKITYYAKMWPPTMFDPFTTHNPSYPLLIPSAQAFIFFWIDQFDDVASRLVFPAFYVAGANQNQLCWFASRRFPAGNVWL